MNKTIVIITGIIVAGLLIGYYIYSQNKSPSEKIKPEKIVIKMVKSFHFSGSRHNTKDKIKYILGHKKGDFKVIGWEAKRIEENTYLVSFTYEEDGKKYGWFFEVKPIGEIVREVSLDQELMGKYNVANKVVFTEEEAAELRDLKKKNKEYREISNKGSIVEKIVDKVKEEFRYLPPDEQKKAINLKRKRDEYNKRILMLKRD